MVTVSSEFSSYRSQRDIDAAVAQLNSPKINQCVNAHYKVRARAEPVIRAGGGRAR